MHFYEVLKQFSKNTFKKINSDTVLSFNRKFLTILYDVQLLVFMSFISQNNYNHGY